MERLKHDLSIDCDRIPDLVQPELVKAINAFVTDPPEIDVEDGEAELETLGGVEVGNMEELNLAQENDYHHVRDPGRIASLVEWSLPAECEENNDVIWLTSVLIKKLAEAQAFGEGNKRTAYLSGMIFFLRAQKVLGYDHGVYPTDIGIRGSSPGRCC
ncbi:MAG: hypothetical protein ABEJ99_03355 [Candidatus Nanohaloarchaea archaeon]